MKDFHKKESPFQGITGLAGGATGLRMSSAATKIYLDEVFSTYLYAETGTTVTVNNGVDMSEGGMVWFKNREATDSHALIDTARGGTKVIHSESTAVESTQSGAITSFNTNGFEIGNYGAINGGSNKDVASWSFRKSEGFFDVVTWTGTGSAQLISHSLGSVPGFIMIKCTNDAENWVVYHRDISPTSYLRLNTNAAQQTDSGSVVFGGVSATDTTFSVGTHALTNGNGNSYIAYVFAGGASAAATAKSVDFDGGANDSLSLAASTDFNWTNLANDPFTIEFWMRPDSWDTNDTLVRQDNGGYWIHKEGSNFKFGIYDYSGTNYDLATTTQIPDRYQWTHVAVVRQAISNGGSNPIKLYFNGTEVGSGSVNYTHSAMTTFRIGSNGSAGFDGKISNFRFTKAEVYTSSFKPPTEPLANITGTKLLCCNDSSTTGSTVTPGTITANGTLTASTDSPFDDSEGFKFGSGGEGIIKVGSYKGNGGSAGPIVDLGWEPQWVMVKNLDSTGNWFMFDSMRGIITDGFDAKLHANENSVEELDHNWLDMSATGFQLKSTNSNVNGDHYPYVYVAIRRADGWVSKPADAGTDVFTMDTGAGGSTMPQYDSGFPVDFAIYRIPESTSDWWVNARLVQGQELKINSTSAQSSWAGSKFDSNAGWAASGSGSTQQSWMWKRGPGFDAVAYEGSSASTRIIRHSLGSAPDMMWIKNRDASHNWLVGHFKLDGGTDPWTHYMYLNTTDAEGDYDFFADKAPTAYSFEVSTAIANDTNNSYLALLFKSITGISKCGVYTGDTSGLTVTTGFQPRFIMIRRTDTTSGWAVFDTLRGLTGTNNKMIYFNEDSTADIVDAPTPTATGFSFSGSAAQINENTGVSKYIYYAHA